MFLDSYGFLQENLSNIAKSINAKDFKILGKCFNINIFRKKGIYPYEHITSLDVFNETELPPIEAFYSTLYIENITKDEYGQVQNIWRTFKCITLFDNHNIYLKVDVLILSDAFEKFRDFFLTLKLQLILYTLNYEIGSIDLLNMDRILQAFC